MIRSFGWLLLGGYFLLVNWFTPVGSYGFLLSACGGLAFSAYALFSLIRWWLDG